MKKTLFSLAFLAASGGYVVYANHGLDGVLAGTKTSDETATAAVVGPAIKTPATPTVPDRAPDARVAPVVVPVPVAPTLTPPKAIVASATPVVHVPAPAATTVAMPPLPRPRPADAPTIQTAQAATVAPASGDHYRDGTYTGTDENAYYGRVQVQVTVAGSQITSIKPLDYPSDRRTSRYINGEALPTLQQEVIQAQSANVDTVSGATLTSEAYIKSLGNALRKAAGGNA